MMVGGDVVAFIGDVAVFSTEDEASAFVEQIKQSIARYRDLSGTRWSVPVKVYLLDQEAIRRCANERRGPPYPGEAVVF